MNAENLLSHDLWVIDLDGVIWRGPEPIPGSAAAIDSLQKAGNTVVFATNNASLSPEAFEAKLNGHGIYSHGNMVSSAMAAATLVSPGESVYVVGADGLRHSLTDAGAILVEDEAATVDSVVVGITRAFDYTMLRRAARAVMGGARLIAANTDASFPAADGVDPGNGALVAAIETASGATAEVAGKPHEPMARLIRQRWGDAGICVGDRPETDGEFAVTLGFDFALVLSGVTAETDLPVEPEPQFVAADLASIVLG